MDAVRVIEQVLDAHNRAAGSSYLVTRYPDRDNPGSDDIDAYAVSPDLPPLAIEHTKVESLQDQIRDSARFMRGLGLLEAELEGSFPFWLGIELPHRSVEPGQDWDAVRRAIRTWLLANAPNLPVGRTTHHPEGVPFPLAVWKSTSSDAKVFLLRQTPLGDRDELLLARMHEGLDQKYVRLGKYRREGAGALIVLESEDVALVSVQSLYLAFLRAIWERWRPDLDQVWLASPCGDECPVYCFLGPDEVMACVNPADCRFGPLFAREWLPDGT